VIIQSSKASNHDNHSILFERWELCKTGKELLYLICMLLMSINLEDGILVIEDYNTMEVKEHGIDNMITVVLPFATGWPKQFMSFYR